MNRLDNPVDSGIPTNGFMLRIDEDDLKILVGRVLIDPVRVENPKIGTSPANSFFSSRLERSLVFKLIHTLVGGLACTERSILRACGAACHGAYHRLHPSELASCDHRVGLSHGR